MPMLGGDVRVVFWAATLPAFFAVLVLVVAVHESHDEIPRPAQLPLSPAQIKGLPLRYWLIVALGSVLTLARFSEAFLVLRAINVGLPVAGAPLVLIVMNVVYAVAAYPVGVAADHLSGRSLLVAGLAVLVAADIALAITCGVATALVGVALWGLHMGLTQGLLATLVAATAPAALRGTAFGIFNLATGVFLLIASALAGVLWSRYGASATFLAGGGFAAVAMVGILCWAPRVDGWIPGLEDAPDKRQPIATMCRCRGSLVIQGSYRCGGAVATQGGEADADHQDRRKDER